MKEPLAAPEKHSYRNYPETLHKYRTEFERDRDRILYSKAFRRLSVKTQIFLPLAHDHVRNRLTHTLEVSQIAKVTCKNLQLDVNLAEAIALGHDLGHTPFGHVGERTLNLICNNCEDMHPYFKEMTDDKKGFKHNLHGLRVACSLEKMYRRYPGMNLTNFTLWGIRNHSKLNWDKKDLKTGKALPCSYIKGEECFFQLQPKKCSNDRLSCQFYDQYNSYIKLIDSPKEAWSFEGLVVALADEIAQRHHDVEDAIYMRIVSLKELKDITRQLFKRHFDKEDNRNFASLNKEKNEAYFLPLISRFIVNFLNKNLIRHSRQRLSSFSKYHKIDNKADFFHSYENIDKEKARKCIGFDKEFSKSQNEFHRFLKNRVLNSYEVQRMDGRGTYIIRKLIKAFLTNPKQLSDATLVYIENIYKGRTSGTKIVQDLTESQIGKLRADIDDLSKKSSRSFQIHLLRGICDHIAGMTDNYAITEFKRLYGIEPVIR